MKKCKSCQTEIDEKATKCPNCQTDQRGFFRRHPVLSAIGAIIIFFAIVGAMGGGGNEGSTNPSSTNTTTTSTATPTEAPKDVTPKIGDVTVLGEREFTVQSVRRTTSVGYSSAETGKEFVIVDVKIKNLGDDEVSFNPYDFKVQDANGVQKDSTYADIENTLSYGTLAPGGEVTGLIPFEIPKGSTALLIYQPSFWSSQRVVVDLGTE